MTERKTSPKQALDYPTIPGDLVVIWHGNEYRWPDGRRQTSVLGERTDAMKGYALMEMEVDRAKVFSTREEAEAWLTKQTELRGRPYHDVKIGTVHELIADRFAV